MISIVQTAKEARHILEQVKESSINVVLTEITEQCLGGYTFAYVACPDGIEQPELVKELEKRGFTCNVIEESQNIEVSW